jgi:hypothetical protein
MFFNVMGFSCLDAHLSTALVFILPKRLDFCERLYYNVWIVRKLYLKKVKQMTGVEFILGMFLWGIISTGEPFMVCVSGCI